MSEPLTGTPARLYTIAEAAEFLSMSETWLKRQIQARKVRHVRMGRSVRFTDEHLQAIIASFTCDVVTPRRAARNKL